MTCTAALNVTWMGIVPALYRPSVAELVTFVTVGAPPAKLIVKFVSLMSQKMLPAASTFTRQVELTTPGRETDWVPSFGVLASSVVGKVFPPSVERRMLTLAAFTGAPLVPTTFHVTVWGEVFHVTAVFGAVTANGVAFAALMVMIASSELMPPPPARLSRT